MKRLFNLTIVNSEILKGGLYTLYSFVNQGISFLILILLARFILPEEYGYLSLFNTILLFLGYFMALSSAGYISISYFKKSQELFKKDLSAIIILAIISLILYLLLLVPFILYEFSLGFNSIYLIFAVFISFFLCIHNLFLDYLRIIENIVLYGVCSIAFGLLNLGLSLLFVIYFKQGWLGRVEAQLICSVVFAVIAFVFFYTKSLYSFDFSSERYKNILKWGIPIIPHLASIWIRQGGDRYIINYYHSTTDVGLFSFALNLASVIIMVGMAFNSSNSVYIYKVLAGKETDKWNKLKKQTRKIILAYIFATVIITSTIVCIVPLFLPDYKSSLSFFLILVIYGLMQCVYFLYCNYLFYYDKTQELMYITFGTSIIHLLLSLMVTKYSLSYTCFVYIFIQLTIVLLVRSRSINLLKSNKII